MSFANQALAIEYLASNAGDLAANVYDVSADIDQRVAALKLEAMGVAIDTLTEEQAAYLSGWQEGT